MPILLGAKFQVKSMSDSREKWIKAFGQQIPSLHFVYI